MQTLLRLRTFFAVLVFFTIPMLTMGNSWFYSSGGVSLPNTANVILDIDGNATAGMNGGSVSDGDSISTYVERSSVAESWTESGTNRPTYKANILNGKGVFRFVASSEQRLKSSARTLISAGSAFTIYAVVNLSSFDQPYKYFLSCKGASAAASPSMAMSTNASFKDLFWGADTTWGIVLRFTSITSIAGNWKWLVLRYNGGTSNSSSNYTAYNAGSALTTTVTASNDGDGTNNLIGAYKTTSNPYAWNGDIARLVIWNTDIGSGGVTSLATYNTAQYAF